MIDPDDAPEPVTESETPLHLPDTFELALDAIQGRTVALTCAINAARYLAAWTEASELRRALARADILVKAISEPAGRDHAMGRLNELCVVAGRMLALAPQPSAEAIRQARSSDWRADRSVWEREERVWIAARLAIGPLHRATTRPRRTRAETLPETPRALVAAAARATSAIADSCATTTPTWDCAAPHGHNSAATDELARSEATISEDERHI